MSKFQLHPSSMESLARCGVAFERRSINGEKTPSSARMAVGTAVDRSVRENLLNKLTFNELLPLAQVKDVARDALVAEWEKGVRITEEDREEGLTQARGIDSSVTLAGFHHVELAPKIKPTHVARKIVLEVDGLSLQVAMELDIQEGLTAIRDTKTSGKSPLKTLADESLQLSAYALGVRQIDGALPDKVVLDYLVQTPKRGDLKLVQLESVRTDAQLQPVLERLAHMDKIIQAGIFTPAPIGAWWCSARYCAYHDSCRFAARPVTVHVTSPAAGVGNGAGVQSVPTLGPPTAKSSSANGSHANVASQPAEDGASGDPPVSGSLPRKRGPAQNYGAGEISGGVSAISPPDDLEDRLRQSLEMANGTRKLHLVAKGA